jgi:uncharacterized protein (DUF1501 family)
MSDHDHDHETPTVPQHLLDAAAEGCAESRALINRRNLLGLSAGLFAWAHMPRHAEAAGTEPRLLIVNLAGALDGLHVAVPLNDYANYTSLRAGLALPKNLLLPFTSEYALNAAMPKFRDVFLAGDAALVQAIAPPLQISSHFECQYNLESGLPGGGPRSCTTGWMNRLLNILPAGTAVKTDAMHVGPTPFILAGPAPVLSWLPGIRSNSTLTDPLTSLYHRAGNPLSVVLGEGERTYRLAESGASGTTTPPTASPLMRSFLGTARLLKDPAGPRIAVLSTGGWDTHATQASILTTKLSELDACLDAFRIEMGEAAWKTTAVVCVTEMGRRAYVNGTTGTDQGVASVAFLLGGAINGNKVFGSWPGLANADLVNGASLRATTDMRAVFKGLLQDHLGVPRTLLDTEVFPASQTIAPMQDLLKAPTVASASPALTMAAASSVATTSSRSARSTETMASPRRQTALARFRRKNGLR